MMILVHTENEILKTKMLQFQVPLTLIFFANINALFLPIATAKNLSL